MENFISWLDKELIDRKWKPADLAREAKLSSAVVSNILNGHRRIGEKTGNAIARALRLPAELVFEKAGLLPPKTELTPNKRELMEKLKTADDATVRLAIEMLEVAVRNKQREIPNNINPKTTPR